MAHVHVGIKLLAIILTNDCKVMSLSYGVFLNGSQGGFSCSLTVPAFLPPQEMEASGQATENQNKLVEKEDALR